MFTARFFMRNPLYRYKKFLHAGRFYGNTYKEVCYVLSGHPLMIFTSAEKLLNIIGTLYADED